MSAFDNRPPGDNSGSPEFRPVVEPEFDEDQDMVFECFEIYGAEYDVHCHVVVQVNGHWTDVQIKDAWIWLNGRRIAAFLDALQETQIKVEAFNALKK